MATISKLFSMREAAEHNTRDDCWVVVDGKVYDVTSYLDEHPGGDDVLLSAVGKDSTEDFEDAGHSNDARELMKNYCIGEIEADPVMPELEIVRKDQPSRFTSKIRDMPLQYWATPAIIIGIATIAGIIYSRKN